MISVIFARGLLFELRRQGLDPEALLRVSQLDRTRLTDLRNTLTLEEADVLVRSALALSESPTLGLDLGVRAPYAMLQVFGLLVQAQPTLRDAFVVLRHYSPLLADGFRWDLRESGEHAVFLCEPDLQLGDTTRFAVEFAMAMAHRTARHFLPKGAAPEEAYFQHPMPEHAERYERTFRCRVHFDHPTNGLRFSRAYLDHRQLHADVLVNQALRRVADRLLREKPPSLRLRERIEALVTHQTDPHRVTLEAVAAQVGVSTRTIRQSLRKEGVNLSSLIDQARCKIACEELKRPDTTIRATARRLGFAKPSGFHRAFRRWTGRTPVEFVHLQEPLEGEVERAHPYALARFRKRA